MSSGLTDLALSAADPPYYSASRYPHDIANILAGNPADIRDISESAGVSRVSYPSDTSLVYANCVNPKNSRLVIIPKMTQSRVQIPSDCESFSIAMDFHVR